MNYVEVIVETNNNVNDEVSIETKGFASLYFFALFLMKFE